MILDPVTALCQGLRVRTDPPLTGGVLPFADQAFGLSQTEGPSAGVGYDGGIDVDKALEQQKDDTIKTGLEEINPVYEPKDFPANHPP